MKMVFLREMSHIGGPGPLNLWYYPSAYWKHSPTILKQGGCEDWHYVRLCCIIIVYSLKYSCHQRIYFISNSSGATVNKSLWVRILHGTWQRIYHKLLRHSSEKMEKLLVAVLSFIGLAVCSHSNRPMTRAEVKTMLKHHDVVPKIIDESENVDQLVVSLNSLF